MKPQRILFMMFVVMALVATIVWYRRSTATELPDGRRFARPGRRTFDREYKRWSA